MENSNWRLEAKCANTDPETFFPMSSVMNHGVRSRVMRDARESCMECPVRLECVKEGIATDSEGIWGGVYFSSVLKHRKPRQKQVLDLIAGGSTI